MTLEPRPILTNGATHPAQQFRNLIADLSRDSEGVTRGTDLKVTQLSTPGTSVQVASGTGIVRGRAANYQGSYAVMNVGSDTVPIASTGASPRSDMLIIRIEDKEYEGNIDPTTGQVNYFQIISNVSSSATTIPDGRTGIPLARIDIPASTSTITNAMIKDIRTIANPRRERRVWVQTPTATSADLGASSVYSYFSTSAGWNISVPSWASTATILVTGSSLKLNNSPFYGGFRAAFGASLIVQNVTIDDQGSGTRRTQSVAADTLTLPDAYRGTTQLLRAQAAAYTGNVGRIAVDASSTLIADVEFTEAAR